MLKLTRQELQNELERLVAKWRHAIGLEYYDLKVWYTEKKHAASAVALPHYRDGAVYFNLGRLRREMEQAEKLEDLVVHELCHIPLWEVCNRGGPHPTNEDGVDPVEEAAVSDMAGTVLRAYRMGLKEGEKRARMALEAFSAPSPPPDTSPPASEADNEATP